MKIKFKLLISLTLLAVIPITIASIVNYFYSAIELENLMYTEAKAITSKMRYDLEKIHDNAISNLAAISGMRTIQENVVDNPTKEQRGKIEQILDDILRTNHIFDAYQIISDKGKQIYKVYSDKSLPIRYLDVSDRQYFKNPLSIKRPYVSDVVMSRITHLPIMTIGYPFYNDEGKIIGVISGFVSLKKITDLITHMKTTPGSYPFITSDQGLILAHPDPALIMNGNLFKVAKIDKNNRDIVLNKSEGFISYLYKSRKKFLYFTHDKSGKYIISYTIPRSDFFLAVNRIRLIILIDVAFFSLLSLIIASLLSRKITNPLNIILSAIARINKEDYDFKVDYKSKDELMIVVDNFNNMIVGLKERKQFKDELANKLQKIQNLNEIGIALSAENELNKLIELILHSAKKFSNADGGAFYLKTKDGKFLNLKAFEIDSLNMKIGGSSGEIARPPLSLFHGDGSVAKEMIVTSCALRGNVINLADVYDAKVFDIDDIEKFDTENNYKSKSVLVIPMRNYENEVIGVMQLINKQVENRVTCFNREDLSTTLSLASQAAIAITNVQLLQEVEDLLESFIKTISTAIDAKSPYTAGHIRRVAEITMMIVDEINKTSEGKYRDIFFNKDQAREMKLAAWMHDIGKITTPEYVVDKAVKLETIFDRFLDVRIRFELLKREARIALLEKKLKFYKDSMATGSVKTNIEKSRMESIEKEYEQKIASIEKDLQFIKMINVGVEFMPDEKIDRIAKIAEREFTVGQQKLPVLSQNEVYNLSIRKGTLTDVEREKIKEHAFLTYKMLDELPFPKPLKNVPEIAGSHHEKLNGTGYPRGLKSEQLSLEARILVLADIFEALTASDRPYKKAKKLSEATTVIDSMVKKGELDEDLVKFFYDKKLHTKYAIQELKPVQLR